MLDTQGFIAEGATESIFLVEDGRLLTPCWYRARQHHPAGPS